MKNGYHFLFAIVFFHSCKSYHYYATPVNAPVFLNGGEVHANGNVGIAGFTTMGGASITKNFSVSGLYNGSPGVSSGYHSKQGETAAGFHIPIKKSILSFHGGFGWGNNYDQDSGDVVKSFYGSFSKPFLIITYSKVKTIGKRIRAESGMSLKTNYLIYNGFKNVSDGSNGYVPNKFYSEVFFYEPYVNTSIGGKHVRFDVGMGFAFKRLVQIDKGARVHPVNMQFGLTFIFGRKYDE
ncbi:MAG TPA: hypothetical protein VD905_06740 [Flavobacteriales bacterium]|nr:hypothetical protein [Flavobacteriales bacterium]